MKIQDALDKLTKDVYEMHIKAEKNLLQISILESIIIPEDDFEIKDTPNWLQGNKNDA